MTAPSKNSSSSIVLILLSSAVLATAGELAADGGTGRPGKWQEKMDRMGALLTELLPDIASESRFNEPKRRAKIEKNLKSLTEMAHSLPESAGDESSRVHTQDPGMKLIGALFESETRRAHDEFKRGHREYSRNILRGVTSYCISCHSADPAGKPALRFSSSVEGLDALEQAEYLASTRQFDPALDAFEKIIDDRKFARNQPFRWTRAVRYALSLSIRARNRPDDALKVIDRILKTKEAPLYLREEASAWRQSVEEWKKEKSKAPLTEEGLFAEATRLVTRARQTQSFPADRSGDVWYLRTSAAANDLLKHHPNGKRVSEALLLAGMSADVLRDLHLWTLHEMYYEACIRQQPGSPVAEDCYRRYERSIYSGYSGSSGNRIPADVRKRLGGLREMARPRAAK